MAESAATWSAEHLLLKEITAQLEKCKNANKPLTPQIDNIRRKTLLVRDALNKSGADKEKQSNFAMSTQGRIFMMQLRGVHRVFENLLAQREKYFGKLKQRLPAAEEINKKESKKEHVATPDFAEEFTDIDGRLETAITILQELRARETRERGDVNINNSRSSSVKEQSPAPSARSSGGTLSSTPTPKKQPLMMRKKINEEGGAAINKKAAPIAEDEERRREEAAKNKKELIKKTPAVTHKKKMADEDEKIIREREPLPMRPKDELLMVKNNAKNLDLKKLLPEGEGEERNLKNMRKRVHLSHATWRF